MNLPMKKTNSRNKTAMTTTKNTVSTRSKAVKPPKKKAESPASIVHALTMYWYGQNPIGCSLSDNQQNLACAYGHALDSLTPEVLRDYCKQMEGQHASDSAACATKKGPKA